MKSHLKHLCILALSCVACSFLLSSCRTTKSISDPPRAYASEENITVHKGNVCLSHVVTSLFHDDFHTRDEHWQTFLNHENRLLFTYGEKDGISGLILLKDPKIAGHDTAFEFRSKPFSVIGSAVFTFSIVASGSVDMIISSPFGESYFNLIEWYDNEGNIISATPFKYSSRLHSPTETKISGDIPANASKAVIRIGADRPNILENDYVIFSSLDFSSQNPKGDVYPKGNFISRPFYRPNQGKLSWDATVPSQTSVSFQIATARDNNGVPDEWSAFVGPGNNPLRHFTESGTELPTFSPNRPWVCYKASFIGLNEHSPELRSVTISQFTDRNWKGKDRCCPEITRLTPSCPQDASAPVAFHITDDSLVNWSQARLFLDGRDVTSQTRRESDVFIFQPEQPLKKSTPDIRDIATWRLVQNHNFAIAFHDLPDTPNAIRFARQGTETEIYARLKSPEIVVTPGQEFSFSINARGTASNDGTDSSLPIHLYWCGERGAQLGSPILLKSIEKSTDWKTYSHSFIVPNGAHKGYILITLNQSNLPKGTFIEFSNPKIEGNGCKPQAFTPRNLHKFTVAAEDFLGHKAIKDFHILVAPEPRTKNVVTLRHDGAVLVDGKPFFPIGMYAVWKREHNDFDLDKAFKELHEAGFNLAHSYNATRDDEYKEFMDAALRHDVKLFIPGGKGVNSTDIDEIISDIANERNHPAVLAWYLSDDTAAYISPEKLSEINEAVHDIDPTRPTVQADPVGIKISRYRPYVNATDGFLPELYPVSTGTPPDMTVPKIITDMKMIQADLASKGSPAKTIWPIIQYFKGWGGWTRFPTFEELRAMSYESIIHGGNGITFYTYIRRRADNFGVLATPETWQNMKKVAGELNHLSPVFLAETPKQPQIVNILSGPQQDAQGHDSISTLYKVIDQKQYLICANSAFKDVTVNFVLPHAHRCDVLFEERTLNVSKNSFNDTFAPYAVHVYEIR